MNEKLKKLIENKLSYWSPSREEMRLWWDGVMEGLELTMENENYNHLLKWCSNHSIEKGKVVHNSNSESDG